MVVLESHPHRLTNLEKQHLEECYSYFIRDLFSERTTSVLHVAVRDPFELKRVKLILILGGDPNAIDQNGRTPLHILAGVEDIHWSKNVSIFQTPVDAGTHLDMAADNGDTVISVLKRNLVRVNESGFTVNPYYNMVSGTVFPLCCYCARVIGQHGIRYDEDRLPLHLQEFVSGHSAAQGK